MFNLIWTLTLLHILLYTNRLYITVLLVINFIWWFYIRSISKYLQISTNLMIVWLVNIGFYLYIIFSVNTISLYLKLLKVMRVKYTSFSKPTKKPLVQSHVWMFLGSSFTHFYQCVLCVSNVTVLLVQVPIQMKKCLVGENDLPRKMLVRY